MKEKCKIILILKYMLVKNLFFHLFFLLYLIGFNLFRILDNEIFVYSSMIGTLPMCFFLLSFKKNKYKSIIFIVVQFFYIKFLEIPSIFLTYLMESKLLYCLFFFLPMLVGKYMFFSLGFFIPLEEKTKNEKFFLKNLLIYLCISNIFYFIFSKYDYVFLKNYSIGINSIVISLFTLFIISYIKQKKEEVQDNVEGDFKITNFFKETFTDHKFIILLFCCFVFSYFRIYFNNFLMKESFFYTFGKISTIEGIIFSCISYIFIYFLLNNNKYICSYSDNVKSTLLVYFCIFFFIFNILFFYNFLSNLFFFPTIMKIFYTLISISPMEGITPMTIITTQYILKKNHSYGMIVFFGTIGFQNLVLFFNFLKF